MRRSATCGSSWWKGSVPNEAHHVLAGLRFSVRVPRVRALARGVGGTELRGGVPARAVRRFPEASRPAGPGGDRAEAGLDVPAGAVARAGAWHPVAAAGGLF